LEIDQAAKPLFIHTVATRKPDQTVKQAVASFLQAWRKGERCLADPSIASSDQDDALCDAIPSADLNKWELAYYRHRPRKRPS
jgi:hypothetical protein